MATALRLTPSESVVVRRSIPSMLEVEATYGPGGSPPPPHLHPSQSEHFEVLDGILRAQVSGEDRELRAGDTLDVPAGAVHRMWNPADVPARVRWDTTPRGRTEQWFEQLDALQREGRVGRNGMPGPLAFGVYLTEYSDTMELAVRPRFLVRGLLRLLGAVGRRRGYTPAASGPSGG
jgi:quercetin dioxygenase-like cupin family protein